MCSLLEKHNKGHRKKEGHPYGIIVGRIVKKKGKGQLPFKQIQRMSWKLVDIDASKLAGKCRPDEWTEWSQLMRVYDASKYSVKDTPPEMLEFVPLDSQVEDVDESDEEDSESQPPLDDVEDKKPVKDLSAVKAVKQVNDLACPEYFFKTKDKKRESKKPTKFENEFGSPAFKKPQVFT